MTVPTIATIVRDVWLATTGFAADDTRFGTTRPAEILPSIYRIGAAATASVTLTGLACDTLARTLGTPGRQTTVSGLDASLAFRSERFLRLNGNAPELWAALSADYRASDGWVRIHANYPHHARAIATALGTRADRTEIEAAVARRRATDVESAVLEAGGAAAALQSRESWRASEAGRAVLALPLVEITKIGEAPARPPNRPLRVLDLTRVLSGPLCCKILASLGADVLRIDAPRTPDLEATLLETGFGKRAALLDLATEPARENFAALARGADALVQSYRPGALAAIGLGADSIAALRPGIVYVSISAYGRKGPWAPRRGFDSLVQLATGLADAARLASGAHRPVALPAQALDHATGWLAAFGTLVALERRTREGGSWRVDLSLARTAEWLASLGAGDARGAPAATLENAGSLIATTSSPFGTLEYLRSPLILDGERMDARTPPPIPSAPLWF